jgi:hypothetical protein
MQMSQIFSQQKREQSGEQWNALKAAQETKRLTDRFGDKSWSEANRWWRNTAEVTSYVVNFISILGAFYGVYWVMSFVSPWPALTAALSLGLLIGLEALQRKSCDEFWDHKFRSGKASPGWMALKLSLLGIAALASSFGTYQGTKDMAPKAEIITQDSTLAYLQAQADQLNKQIGSAQSNKNEQGVTFYHSQRAVKQLSAAQTRLIGSITDRITATDAKNQDIEQQQLATVEMVATITTLFYILLEIIFQLAMRYMSLYDYRLYLELVRQPQQSNRSNAPNQQPVANPYTAQNPANQFYQNNTDRTVVKGFQPQPTTPPPPVGKTPVGVVATTPTANSPQPTAHSPQVVSSTEIVEEIELQVVAQLDRFGKYYPSKWNNRGKGGGRPETIAANLADCLRVIEQLLDVQGGAALTQKTILRYDNCRTEYITNVAPHVQTTQP